LLSPARPSASGPAIDLLQQADAYQTSVVQHNNQGHAIQIVNTFYSARSFTNQKDVYYVEQEIAVQGTTSAPTIQATSDNAMLDPVGSPLTRAPSPQSSAQETTITSEVSQSIGGSIGFTQGEGFNATLEAGVTISNSKTVTVPPVSVTYKGNLVTGDTSWAYATTGSQKIRTSTFYNQWLWEVPFSLYSTGATRVTIGTGASNAYEQGGQIRRLSAYLDSIVPTPFGDVYQLGNPVITGVDAAVVSPGSTFVIEGQALYPGLVESVLIGGVAIDAQNYRPLSDTRIVVVAPDIRGNALPVVVRTSQGFSNANITIAIKR
jgi:hypothetical protein